MTLTSLNPPMSGTRTSMGLATGLDRQRVGFFRIDTEALHGVGHRPLVDLVVVGKRLERGDGHIVAVHFEKSPQLGARIAAAEAIRAQDRVSSGYPLANLIG